MTGRRLALYVPVVDPATQIGRVLGPDDEVPDWAVAQITTEKAWAVEPAPEHKAKAVPAVPAAAAKLASKAPAKAPAKRAK